MIYLRPISDYLHQSKDSMTLTNKTDYKIEDKTTGKIIVTQINMMQVTIGRDKDGNIHGQIDKVIPNEFVESIYRHLEKKNICGHYGEIINQKLLSFLTNYYTESDKELLQKDFMKLRDYLSDIIKKDVRFHSIEKLNSNTSRKTFTRLFAQFIEDRDIYTHGSLIYRVNDNKILIKYINKPNREFSYAVINFEIMISYENLYLYLKELLTELSNQLGRIKGTGVYINPLNT